MTISYNASSGSGLAMSCPLARQTHRNPNAIVLEALRAVSFRRNADEAVTACKWALAHLHAARLVHTRSLPTIRCPARTPRGSSPHRLA